MMLSSDDDFLHQQWQEEEEEDGGAGDNTSLLTWGRHITYGWYTTNFRFLYEGADIYTSFETKMKPAQWRTNTGVSVEQGSKAVVFHPSADCCSLKHTEPISTYLIAFC